MASRALSEASSASRWRRTGHHLPLLPRIRWHEIELTQQHPQHHIPLCSQGLGWASATGAPEAGAPPSRHGHLGCGVRLTASPQYRLEASQQVVIARRREAAERIEQIGVWADEDARLALLHSAVDDLGGLDRLRQGDGSELLHHLFLTAAEALGILAPSRVSHDVGVDAARMDVDGGHPGAAQLLANR